MFDCTGMGRLTWFPQAPGPDRQCTSSHPQLVWGLQRPNPRTKPNQRCTWGGKWSNECGPLNPPDSTHCTWPHPSSLVPSCGFHTHPRPCHWTHTHSFGSWPREWGAFESRTGTEASQPNGSGILWPLASLRHGINYKSLISEKHLWKSTSLPTGIRECLKGLARGIWETWNQSEVIISEGILAPWVLPVGQ